MSLLDADSRLPSFVLRKHTRPVTSLCFAHAPVALTRRAITGEEKPKREHLTLKPFLLSGDETGNVLLWDLTTRRPVMEKQCHTMQILTIKQLGMDNSVVDDSFFGLILTHGRDNCIKFWRLFDQKGQFTFSEVYELPENALNFSNVDLNAKHLITPNTMNSNAFDIYDVGFLAQNDMNDHRLVRLLDAVDIYSEAERSGKYTFDEFKLKREEGDANRADKFGIIMKLLWVKSDLIYVGYESGHVAAIRLNIPEKKIDVLKISKHHYPDPVLSLSYDSKNNVVISSSVSSQIVIHDLQTNTETPVKLDKFGKISSVATINDKYILASWSGFIKFFTLAKSSMSFSYQASFKKPKGMIAADLNVIGNLQESSDISKQRQAVIKPNTMCIVDKSLAHPPAALKLPRRELATLTTSFLAVAYDDGTIAVYTDV